MKSITVQLTNDTTLVVRQLPLRRYGELLAALENLPKLIGGMDKINSDQLFIQLPLILAKSFPDLLAILTVATDLTEEQISSDEFGLKDGVNVVIAILDTNDYREIFEEIKKAWTRLKTAPVEPVSK